MKFLKSIVAIVATTLLMSAPAAADWQATLISLGLDRPGAAGSVDCPPGGSFGTVWGTGTYTSDSSVCTAAVHFGWITQGRGGRVSVQQVGGLQAYQGTTQNGVSTYDYGSWPSSFQITGAAALPGSGAQMNWSAAPDTLGIAGNVGQSYSFVCPPHTGGVGTIWGVDLYTSDSPICVAAQHRGLISPSAGGPVTILILGGQPNYSGLSRNGITSQPYGQWDSSYIFQ